MKHKINCLLAFVLGTMGLVGCNDLDTEPWDRYVTVTEKEDAIALNPDIAAAGVVGISSVYPQCWSVYSDAAHCDFGWPALMMMFDSMSPDFVSRQIGYNWFASPASYSVGTNNNYVNNMSWNLSYKIIKASNSVLQTFPNVETPEQMLYAAQAHANRAYAYFMLAQIFQYTYVGHEDLPCVPILTEKNQEEVANVGGVARSSVREVYEFVLSDLASAIDYLSKCNLTTADIASTGTKRFVSLGTAYGLRARVNLVMNKWSEAADDAQKAIATSGCTPLSIAEASEPGFSDSNDHECMWAIYIQETDRCVTSGIVNYPSMMGSFNSNGYWTVGANRIINKSLYTSINRSDARKGWWLSELGKSPNLTAEQQAFVSRYQPEGLTQVKFGPYQGQIGTVTNANDYFLMRVEEMYLIQAEATAMAGNPALGKQQLVNFVTTYRDPDYTTSANTAEEVQEAVYLQRRIELWGEGMNYFDLLRLNKPMDRRGGGWEADWVYFVEAPLKPLLIPNTEMEANKLIGANNDSWSKPSPVKD